MSHICFFSISEKPLFPATAQLLMNGEGHIVAFHGDIPYMFLQARKTAAQLLVASLGSRIIMSIAHTQHCP